MCPMHFLPTIDTTHSFCVRNGADRSGWQRKQHARRRRGCLFREYDACEPVSRTLPATPSPGEGALQCLKTEFHDTGAERVDALARVEATDLPGGTRRAGAAEANGTRSQGPTRGHKAPQPGPGFRLSQNSRKARKYAVPKREVPRARGGSAYHCAAARSRGGLVCPNKEVRTDWVARRLGKSVVAFPNGKLRRKPPPGQVEGRKCKHSTTCTL